MLRCSGDDTFGPILEYGPDGCYNFDFTLVFEDAFFAIAPCAVVLVLTALRIFGLYRRPVSVRWAFLGVAKLIVYAAQAAVQLALVVLLATGRGVAVRTTLGTSILSFIATLFLAVLSFLENGRSIRPGAILQLFFTSTILLDLPRIRTQWLLEDSSLAAALFSTTFALRILLLVLESVHKWKHATLVPPPSIPPEERQGIFGQIFFWWLAPLFLQGYSHNLAMKDLCEIDEGLKGAGLYERLLKSWTLVDHTQKHCLTTAMVRTFLPELVMSFIPRLAMTAFTLAQPYLINSTITYIGLHSVLPISYGYGLLGGYALCFLGIALCNRLWMHISFRAMAKIRGALVTMIFKTMLTVRAETGNSSSALSLMSTDVDRITMVSYTAVNIVPDIIQIAFALWILGTQLGGSSVAPVIVCILCGVASAFVGKLVPPRQRIWMAAIQKRVGITSDIIGSMKGVKVAGLSDKAEAQIAKLRDYELKQSVQFRKLNISAIMLGIAPGIAMPAVTFTVFAIAQKVSGGSQFGVAQAFTSLSLLNVLTAPVMTLATAWTNLASGLACLDRIQAFLLKEKRGDYRILLSREDSDSPTSGGSTPRKESSGDPTDEKSERAAIEVRKGQFGWSKETAVIKDVDIDIYAGQLTMVVGPVASGKSTLLKALLGEARMLSGSVEFTIPEEVAYCDQDAWLLNQTIRDNITAFQPYEKNFYDSVVEACQLLEDLSQLPKGDNSLIGSQGVSLSGGQKQRVALARAVYNRKPIVILDDILKGLDADTYAKCFAAVLGPKGLLRRSRTTVVLATHNIQLLPQADHIIVLHEDGHIREMGSFDHLNAGDGYVSGLGLKRATVQEFQHVTVEEQEAEKAEKEGALIKLASQKALAKEVDHKEEKSRGKRNADALISYFRSMGTLWFPIFCAFTVINTGFRTAQPLWLNVWTSANEQAPDANAGYYVGIYVLFTVLNLIFMVLQFWTFIIYVIPISAKFLHKKILVAAMHAPLSYFVATDIGEIVNRFSQDMTLVDMPLPLSFMMCYMQFLMAISQVILTCVASGWFAISIPALLLLLFFLQKFYLRTSRQLRLLDLEAKSPLYSYFISSFSGLTAIRGYGWTKLAEDENLKRLNESQRPYYLLFCIQRWLTLSLDLIVAGMAVLLVGIAIALRDTIEPGLLGVALTSVMGIGSILSMVIQTWTQLETSLGAVTRIDQFVSQTPREPDGPDMPPAPAWPSRGAIDLNNLSAQYGDRTVLSDISLRIEPGQKVAICGRSGSGKSTLITLLLRLYQPATGSITIDGIDTSTLNLNALREALVALPQDPMFLAGTVRYNLDPLAKATDEEILAALDKTGLRVVVDEKGGLDANLSTDWLSAGQRQLFCLARAVLRKSKILLLDEATSSLDRESEAKVDELIRTVFHDWTVIVVAHRLKTIADFDKVLVLQDGRMLEFDSPASLLARESTFKTLWDLQES